jgi:hypothetical protein
MEILGASILLLIFFPDCFFFVCFSASYVSNFKTLKVME